jgi:uncharacterized protein with HEPN domain
MPFNDEDTLFDIVESLARLEKLVAGHTIDSFLDDANVQEAVQYRLIALGEAVKRLSREFPEAHPTVEWQAMAGMRDALAHGYDRVNLRIVWETACESAPPVFEYIRPLLPSPEE